MFHAGKINEQRARTKKEKAKLKERRDELTGRYRAEEIKSEVLQNSEDFFTVENARKRKENATNYSVQAGKIATAIAALKRYLK